MLPRIALGSGYLKLCSLEINSKTELYQKIYWRVAFWDMRVRNWGGQNLREFISQCSWKWGLNQFYGELWSWVVFQSCPELRQRSWALLYSYIGQPLASARTLCKAISSYKDVTCGQWWFPVKGTQHDLSAANIPSSWGIGALTLERGGSKQNFIAFVTIWKKIWYSSLPTAYNNLLERGS